MPTVLAIGGTGAQGVPVVKALTEDSKYKVRILTRTSKSAAAIELAGLPGVEIIEGDSYDEKTLHEAFSGVDAAFVNTNGFAIGEKAEIYWGIRMYEIAREHHVKHFLYASLEYGYKFGNYDPKYRAGHLDGKAKVAEFLSAQPTQPMAWSIMTSCLYMEMLAELLAPFPSPDDPDTLVFAAPLGDGRAPLIYLPDLGRYARWLFDHPAKSNGMNLRIATEDVGWDYLAKTFTEITGKKAVYLDITLDQFFASGAFPEPDAKVGHSVAYDDGTLQTFRQNFSGFWNTWKANIVKKDYALLDEILPTRVKTVGEWMKLTGYNGQRSSVLKDNRDAAESRKH